MTSTKLGQRASTPRSVRLLAGIVRAGAFCIVLAACSGDNDTALAEGANASASAATPAAGAVSSFQASASGALSRTVDTGNAFSEAKYGRYHINLASHSQPTMVVAFGRTDQTTPSTGSYPLGDDGFSGTVEIYGEPQREFDIVSGNLEITGAKGDALTGRFSLKAVERGGGSGDLEMKGSFQTVKPD